MISSKRLVCGIFACFTWLAAASDQYIVQDGDTLSEIALKHKISEKIFGPDGGVEKLRRLNDLSNPDRIYPGDSLKMGPEPAPESEASQESKNDAILDIPSVVPSPESEDPSTMIDALKSTNENADHDFPTPLRTLLATEYLLSIGVSQSTLAVNFVDQSIGNARWHSKIASNLSLELMHRFTENWALAGEARWQRLEYHSPSDRLRGKKATNADFGTKIMRDFALFSFGFGIKQIAINPVVPLLNERYQLTSFRGTFVAFDLEKEVKVFDAIILSPHLGFGRLISGKGYGIEVEYGTLIRGAMKARWPLNYIDLFVEPVLERRFIKSELGTSLVNSRSLMLGVGLLPQFW